MFTEKQIAYMKSQRLARIATVARDLQPDVTPVGFEFDGKYSFVSGHNLMPIRKYKNVKEGNSNVALVIDDLASVNPWNPHGIRIYGTAEIVQHEGMLDKGLYLRITPTVSWSWNIERPAIIGGRPAVNVNKTIHHESRE